MEFKERGGFLFDAFETVREFVNLKTPIYQKLSKVFERDLSSYLTLDQWIGRCIEMTSVHKGNWVDPRLSEWTAIEIIIQISECIMESMDSYKRIKQKTEKFDRSIFKTSHREYFNIHPANYLVPKIWLENSFLTWGNGRIVLGRID
ncbi:hypothetical protein MKQ70_22220 [Chitinophaga sedimenti]|uniref:hypothetical protein n=1 Tax=Chitinophaga sedimenti TaxID=2033606 RepID=UPI002003E654|nr:hypothetical protein [Chitinophaga sedimenti]MCK7557570.1 hypothetical protein [Chitinophaga sedimenti]